MPFFAEGYGSSLCPFNRIRVFCYPSLVKMSRQFRAKISQSERADAIWKQPTEQALQKLDFQMFSCYLVFFSYLRFETGSHQVVQPVLSFSTLLAWFPQCWLTAPLAPTFACTNVSQSVVKRGRRGLLALKETILTG